MGGVTVSRLDVPEYEEPPPFDPPGDYHSDDHEPVIEDCPCSVPWPHVPVDCPGPAQHGYDDLAGSPPTEDESPLLFRRWTTAELLDADRTFQWLVRGFMARATYGMVGGERKTLKSYIGTFVDIAVAAGVPLFGHFAVDRPAPVVAYIGEGGRVPYTNRIERIARSMGVDLRDVPLFPMFETSPVQSLRFQATLARDLEELRPALVSLDPLYAYHGTSTNAANLFEEGALLTALSGPCTEAGACLKVTTHFNKTGSGRGLDRLTMAGAQEWSDSWWLVSHRDPPNVEAGEFRLLLEVGSRQWGGSTWDLDLSLGRFDVDMGEFEGDVSWRLARHDASDGDSDEARVLRIATEAPFELTREQLAKAAGGNLQRMRQVTHTLEAKGLLGARLCCVQRSNGRTDKTWLFGPASDVGRGETEGAE